MLENCKKSAVKHSIEKENISQQKFDQIRNVKYHNRKDQEMSNRLPPTFNNAIAREKKKVVLFTDSILKTLSMGKFNSCISGANLQLKSFPGCKALQLDHHTIPILQEQYYDAAGIHVGINDLLNSSSKKSVDGICDDIIKIALRCRSHNIATIFISSIAYSTKVNLQLIRNLNGLLYNACTKYGFHFVDNGAVSKCDLWKDGIHLLETGKAIIANNFISSINYFLENMIPPISSFSPIRINGKIRISYILMLQRD